MSHSVCDPDYECMTGTPKWEVQYYWPDRCWRRVQVCRPEFGRLVPGTDPDRQLEPERLPGDGIMGMRAVRSGSNVLAIHTYSRQHGPATAAQIAVALGIDAPRVVTKAMQTRWTMFRTAGKTKAETGQWAYLWEAI